MATFEVGEDEEEEEKDEDTHSYYSMEAIPQGQCLIINNVNFIDPELHPVRLGSDIDAKELQNLFETFLNFDVELFKNVDLEELHEILQDCQNEDHTLYDALIIIILSHGDSGDIIYTTDGHYIRLNEMAQYFTSTNCPSLSNKPKVFIIQACRGSKQNQAIRTENVQPKEPIESNRAATERFFSPTQATYTCIRTEYTQPIEPIELTEGDLFVPTQAIPTENTHPIQHNRAATEDLPTPTNTHNNLDLEPILDSHVQLSLNDPSIVAPLNDPSIVAPLNDPSIAAPLNDPSIAAPLNDLSINDPNLTTTNIKQDGGDFLAQITPAAQYVANHADFIFAHATIDEFEALRDSMTGSWFIHELIRAIKKYATFKDFRSILVKVNNRLSSDEYIYKGKKQVASITHSCKKDLFFSVNQTNTSYSSSLVSSKMSSLTSILSESLVVSRSFLRQDLPVVATPPLTPQSSITTKTRPKTWSTPPPTLKGSPLVVLKRQSYSTSPHQNILLGATHYEKRDSGSFFSNSPRSSLSSPYSSCRRLSFQTEDKEQVSQEQHHMSSQGYCILINNNNSHYGESKLEEIRKVLEDQLGFHLQIYTDLKRKGIHQLLECLALLDHSTLHCMMIIVLGQGKSKSVKLETIVTRFAKHRSHKSLVDKPKLFLIETDMNEKRYTEFRDDPFVPTIPSSYITIVNNTSAAIDPQAYTFMDYLLQTLRGTEYSQLGFVYQDIMKRTLKVFNMRETGFSVEPLDELKTQLHLHVHKTTMTQKTQNQDTQKQSETTCIPILCTQEKDQEQFRITSVKLTLALSLLIVIRSDTIKGLSEKQTDIMKLCKNSHTSHSSTDRTSISSKATALTLRASFVISEAFGPLAMSTRDKLISKAKLKKVSAIIDIDKQLIIQVNTILSEIHLLTQTQELDLSGSFFNLPPDVNDIVSSSIRLYKRSSRDAEKWYNEQLDLLQAEKEQMERMINTLSTSS